MTTKFLIATAIVAMMASGVFAAPAAAFEQKYMLVSDTPEGIVQREITQSELDVIVQCGIDSPTTSTCTNGPLPRVGASHGLALPIPSGFTTPAGNVPVHKMIFTSFLRSNAGTERIFRCEVNEAPAPAGTGAVTFACFPGSGTFPPVGSSMTQFAAALAATNGGAADTASLQAYQASGGQILLPGLGRVTAQLQN